MDIHRVTESLRMIFWYEWEVTVGNVRECRIVKA